MSHNSRLLILPLIPLALFAILYGILPAFTVIQSDFPNYYTAGKIAHTGIGIDRLYDDEWFQEQIHEAGINQRGKFSPFPPPTALFSIPFSFFEPLTALRLFTVINITLVLASIWLIAKIFSLSILHSIAFVLLSGLGLANCFRLGQLYIVLAFTMILAFYWSSKKKSILAGMSAGTLLPIKYFPFVMIIEAMVKKDWKMVSTAILVTLIICIVSIAVLGAEIHIQFLRSVLGEHLQSHLSRQNPFSSTYQSFDSLFRTLFVFDRERNPLPAINHPVAYPYLKLVTISFAACFAAYAIIVVRRNSRESQIPLAILSLLGLLIAPATATYHFLLLWLPIGILLRQFYHIGSTYFFRATLTCYALIGFLPYKFFGAFSGNGFQTIFAYPRLCLMVILFSISLVAAFQGKIKTQLR